MRLSEARSEMIIPADAIYSLPATSDPVFATTDSDVMSVTSMMYILHS